MFLVSSGDRSGSGAASYKIKMVFVAERKQFSIRPVISTGRLN
jgi:hypothetical protein